MKIIFRAETRSRDAILRVSTGGIIFTRHFTGVSKKYSIFALTTIFTLEIPACGIRQNSSNYA